MGKDGYIYKKEKKTSVMEDGEEKTESVLLFGMTSEYIEFRENNNEKKIEFDSIVKMYHGKTPNPKKLHIVMKDHREEDVPEWVLDEFEDIPEKISEYADLTKTKGPELEKTWLDKLKNYADVSFKIFFIGIVAFTIIGGFFVLFFSPCCFGPIWLLTLIGMIWLGIQIFSESEVEERIWKKEPDL
ncbi:MAG: hypothetical protein ACLFVB_08445 [Thermoplasmata archaeon]